MKSGNTIAVGLGLVLLATVGCSRERGPDTSAAVEAAQAWLSLVDGGQFDASWEQASDHFRSVVSKEGWTRALNGVRTPLGGVVERKLAQALYQESLPGAPDGKYVVIFFDTVFENKKQSRETVTPGLDSNGVWRVSGYYIK